MTTKRSQILHCALLQELTVIKRLRIVLQISFFFCFAADRFFKPLIFRVCLMIQKSTSKSYDV